MKKAYPGHAKRVMMAVWSYLRQFMYTKFVIVVDHDIDARSWKDVMWALRGVRARLQRDTRRWGARPLVRTREFPEFPTCWQPAAATAANHRRTGRMVPNEEWARECRRR